jgi:flagellar protein FlaG
VEIIGINGVVAGVGQSGRVSQAPPRSPMPQSAETSNIPGQAAPNTDEAHAIRRAQEANNPGNAGQAASLERAVQESVEKLNEFIRPYVTSLHFSVDKDLGKVVVKIMDNETKEVIKQFPSEDILALSKALGKVAGLIVKQEA